MQRLNRWRWPLLIVGGAVVTAMLIMRVDRRGLRQALGPYLAPTRPGAPIQAAVLLQRADCTGNLRLFDLLHLPRVRPALRLAVVWYVGAATDTLAIRAALPPWTAVVPLRTAPHSALRELRRLGHRETPMLIVLDEEGRIRFTSRSPRSLREFAGLRRIVEGLTWIEAL